MITECLLLGKISENSKYPLTDGSSQTLNVDIREVGPATNGRPPTNEIDDCMADQAANDLIAQIQDGKWNNRGTPSLACTGHCQACAKAVTLSVSSERIES